ncbi:protein FLOURY 1-like [Typha angustifolia]|uniref:protein FLOURY 1-like n=1 Tax=Typha angustifolia TaxID=59011 RepID=UPI003C30D0CD
MLRWFRFVPRLCFKNLSFWLNGICCGGKAHMQIYLGFLFGFFALLWGSCIAKEWDFGLGFLPSMSLYNLFVFLPLLFLGFKVWSLAQKCRELEALLSQLSNVPTNRLSGLSLNGVPCAFCGSKIPSWQVCQCGSLKGNLERSCKLGTRNCISMVRWKEFLHEFGEKEGDRETEEDEESDEDEEDYIMLLRKKIKKERRLREAAFIEVEKERKASSSAADEAMAKILTLQSEKALIEREARQYREIAEQKQLYDQQVIESLQWFILRFEAERRQPESLFKLSETSVQNGLSI